MRTPSIIPAFFVLFSSACSSGSDSNTDGESEASHALQETGEGSAGGGGENASSSEAGTSQGAEDSSNNGDSSDSQTSGSESGTDTSVGSSSESGEESTGTGSNSDPEDEGAECRDFGDASLCENEINGERCRWLPIYSYELSTCDRSLTGEGVCMNKTFDETGCEQFWDCFDGDESYAPSFRKIEGDNYEVVLNPVCESPGVDWTECGPGMDDDPSGICACVCAGP